jgi:predicted metal-dependent hydrolase
MTKQDKHIYIPEIGDVVFRKSNRAKKVNIRLEPFIGVTVRLPQWISYKQAEEIVMKRKSWILRNQSKISQIENKKTVFDGKTKFKTRKRELHLSPHKSKYVSVCIEDKNIHINYPYAVDIYDEQIQTSIRYGIEKALRFEAHEYLPHRVRELAKMHDFHIERIFIKNAKTRWGSCSNVNNINLNIHLMRLPEYLSDYVIIHELCHTKVKNHSHDFWKLLHAIIPNARELDRELNKYHLTIW